jgi:hypothetical protein
VLSLISANGSSGGKERSGSCKCSLFRNGVVIFGFSIDRWTCFNIGNIAGADLGLMLPGSNVPVCHAVVASLHFIKRCGRAPDYFTRFMALTISLLIDYTVYGTAAVGRGYTHLWPTAFDAKATVTLVGGTVVHHICRSTA